MRARTGPTRSPLRRKGNLTVTAERSDKLIQPNAQHQYEVTTADLPLACPMPGMHLWNSHPRVFLPIEKTGTAKCPYCSAEYTLRK
jgi:uncharacterized Zn-finger protein